MKMHIGKLDCNVLYDGQCSPKDAISTLSDIAKIVIRIHTKHVKDDTSVEQNKYT